MSHNLDNQELINFVEAKIKLFFDNQVRLENTIIRPESINLIFISLVEALDTNYFEQKIKNELVLKFPTVKNFNIIITKSATEKPVSKKIKINFAKKVYPFLSAKGGVGKTTTAVNTAKALAKLGYKVGILDLDFYGPSVALLFNLELNSAITQNKIEPINSENVAVVSLGFLVDKKQAAIWRGPILSKMIYRLLGEVKWPDLDVLIIDMPPGTGDIYQTLFGNFIIDSAVLVSTLEKLSTEILYKSIDLLEKYQVDIRALVFNMVFDEDKQNLPLTNFDLINQEIFKDYVPFLFMIRKNWANQQDFITSEAFLPYFRIAKELMN